MIQLHQVIIISGRKKNSKAIKYKAARRALKQQPEASQVLDAVRTSKSPAATPTKGWAKDPTRSDVKGLDDGSKVARKPFLGKIHAFFARLGTRGAAHTNAKVADQTLKDFTPRLKSLRAAQDAAPTQAEKDRLGKKIQALKKRLTKAQASAAKWQEGL